MQATHLRHAITELARTWRGGIPTQLETTLTAIADCVATLESDMLDHREHEHRPQAHSLISTAVRLGYTCEPWQLDVLSDLDRAHGRGSQGNRPAS